MMIFLEILNTIAALSVPILLLFWAPKIAKGLQKQSGERLATELRAHLNSIAEKVETAKAKYPKHKKDDVLTKDKCEEIKRDSEELLEDVQTGFEAYFETMRDEGRGNFELTRQALAS
ncbi:MAG: hypothetical protein AAF826_02710 [Pseudomonadota bacterium]